MSESALSHDTILQALGFPQTRLGKMVALLLHNAGRIALHQTGSVELHFSGDQVKAQLKGVLILDN